MPTLRDQSTVDDARLDRIVDFDDTSRQFPIRAVLGEAQQQVVTKLWTIPTGSPVLNQGVEGACVGFGITNELRFNPVPIPKLDATFARESIYWRAQEIDPWNGGSYPGANPRYEGTSVLAGIKTAAKLGYYSEYRWAFSEQDLALAVSHQGPAVIGVPWYAGMMRPGTDGYIRATGAVQGGHCCLVIGVAASENYYTIYNSWGATWGSNGRAKVSRADMTKLLAERGEACIVTARLIPSVAPTR